MTLLVNLLLATAIVSCAVDVAAQTDDQATFTPMLLRKLEARLQAPKVTGEQQSELIKEGYIAIGTIRAFQPRKKSDAELAHLLESSILKKAAEVGGDVVAFSREGDLEIIEVPIATKQVTECVQSHEVVAVDMPPPGCTYCVPSTHPQQVCDKSEKKTETRFKTIKGVIAEAMVWRFDPNLSAELSSRPSLLEAAEQGKKDKVEWLLVHGAEVNVQDKNGDTALHYAAFFGHLEVAELLLANQAEVNATDKNGVTPLQFAMDTHHEGIAEFLRQHGGQQ